MKNKNEKLQHLKDLLTIVNDPHVKKPVKDKAWLELWSSLEPSVGKVVSKTISKYYKLDRPSSDLVQDAILESMLWIIKNSKSWNPNKGAAPATYAYNKIAELTMNVIGLENKTIDIDESTEDGSIRKAELELQIIEGSAWGRTASATYAYESEVEHPFDMLAHLADPDVSLLLEALQFLLNQGLINDDGATVCAERVTGTEYSIIAECFGKTEEATRKIAERTNRHLKNLCLEMPRYADLIKLPMIANVVNGKASKKGI